MVGGVRLPPHHDNQPAAEWAGQARGRSVREVVEGEVAADEEDVSR